MKSDTFFGMRYLQWIAQVFAFLFSVALMVAAAIETAKVFMGIYQLNVNSAIQEGLFVLILLEMFYVVRSFIKYGSVNTSLIISVGVVAIVKEVIFKLSSLNLETAAAYTLLFLAFNVGIILENRAFQFQIQRGEKPRSIGNILENNKDLQKTPQEKEEKLWST